LAQALGQVSVQALAQEQELVSVQEQAQEQEQEPASQLGPQQVQELASQLVPEQELVQASALALPSGWSLAEVQPVAVLVQGLLRPLPGPGCQSPHLATYLPGLPSEKPFEPKPRPDEP